MCDGIESPCRGALREGAARARRWCVGVDGPWAGALRGRGGLDQPGIRGLIAGRRVDAQRGAVEAAHQKKRTRHARMATRAMRPSVEGGPGSPRARPHSVACASTDPRHTPTAWPIRGPHAAWAIPQLGSVSGTGVGKRPWASRSTTLPASANWYPSGGPPLRPDRDSAGRLSIPPRALPVPLPPPPSLTTAPRQPFPPRWLTSSWWGGG